MSYHCEACGAHQDAWIADVQRFCAQAMTHPAKFLCGHLAHGYEKCNGCVAEARTREIVEWAKREFEGAFMRGESFATMISEKFLSAPADDDEPPVFICAFCGRKETT